MSVCFLIQPCYDERFQGVKLSIYRRTVGHHSATTWSAQPGTCSRDLAGLGVTSIKPWVGVESPALHRSSSRIWGDIVANCSWDGTLVTSRSAASGTPGAQSTRLPLRSKTAAPGLSPTPALGGRCCAQTDEPRPSQRMWDSAMRPGGFRNDRASTLGLSFVFLEVVSGCYGANPIGARAGTGFGA